MKKHLPQINIKVIPHNKHRYETVGDYFKKDGIWQFRVSKMSCPEYEMLVIMHEQIEWFLCELNGIKEKNISDFDIAYEKARAEKVKAPCGCMPSEGSEPGDDKHAPYYSQHQFATHIEKQLASKFGVIWGRYDKEVMEL